MMERGALAGALVAVVGAGLGAGSAAIHNPWLGGGIVVGSASTGVLVAVLAKDLRRNAATAARAQRDLAAAEARAGAAELRNETLNQALVEAELALADAEAAERRGPETVFDSETGLLDERVFVVSFERKVAAARRHLRPLCLVLVDLAAGLPRDADARAGAVAGFGAVLRSTLRDCDIACRLTSSTFGLILEDTPEGGGVWAAERLQMAVACQQGPPTRVVAAVATYPNHGLAAQEVLQRAQEALARARVSTEDGIGPVEVASADLG